MSFAKASDLLSLAEMATARHGGVSLPEIEDEFGVDRRTAQRMTRALETVFPGCTTRTDDERRKQWKINAADARLMLAQGILDSELAALELAIRRAEREGSKTESRSLARLRNRLLAAMPRPHARRAETDAEALLEAHGYASRPGPQVRVASELLDKIAHALKGPHLLTVSYAGGSTPGRPRTLEPHGLMLGIRRYLIAREAGCPRMKQFRLDRITSARLEASSFERDPDFDLATHAARGFGSYLDPSEYGEVVWRFTPAAAPTARDFLGSSFNCNTQSPKGVGCCDGQTKQAPQQRGTWRDLRRAE